MSVIKEGYVKRYSKSLLHGGWKDIYLMLYSDSTLLAFKKHSEGNPKVRICMSDVCKHFAYGEHAARNFQEFPPLPPGANISCVLAVPERPNQHSKPHFFLMQNERDLHEWMTAICSTIERCSGVSQEQQFQTQPYNYGPQYAGACPTQPMAYGGSSPYYGQYPQQQPVYQSYPVQQPGYPQQQSYGYQQPVQGHSQGHHRKSGGFPGGKAGKIAAGVLGGAALGYGAKKMLGGFGKFGMGRSGSWSSFDSFGSGGSCGSFGSFD